MFDHSGVGKKKRPKRGLDEISHLFLSPHRPPGKEREFKDGKPEKSKEEVSPAADVEHNLCLIFSTYDLSAGKAFLAYKLALELSRRDFAVALIDTPSETGQPSQQISLMKSTVGPGAKIKSCRLAEKGLDSEASVGILKRMTRESNFLVFNSPRDISKLRGVISMLNPFFIVPITENSEVLLRSYMLIKKILMDMHVEEVGVLVMDEKANGKAEKAFCLIAEMVHRFLAASVLFMGVIPFKAPSDHATLSPNHPRQEIEDSAISRSIVELADAVIEQFNHR
jgi:hypothetical protein